MCVEIHDHVMSQLQEAKTYIDTFDYKKRKTYATFYTEGLNVIVENLISKTGASKSELQECLNDYTKEVEQLQSLKNTLRTKVTKALLLTF